jgi:hypothetical protein
MQMKTNTSEPEMGKSNMQDINILLEKVQNLEWWHNLANYFGIGLLVLTAVAALISNRIGARMKTAQDAVIAAKDEQIRHDRDATDKRVAEADKKAAEANAEAGRANESAAKLNEMAQNLEQQNIKLRTDLETATAEARSKQIELTLEQQKMAKEQQITAEAQKEAARTLLNAQFNLQQIRSLHMPRRLIVGENRETFLAAFKDKPVATVDIIWQTDAFIGEPERFAEDVAEALKEAGWAIKGVSGALIANDPDPLNVEAVGGIRIFVRDPETPTPSEQALFWAFLSSGFVVDFFPNKLPEGDVIRLAIFMMPPDGGRVLRLRPGRSKN